MSGAVYVCVGGVPTADRLVRNSRFDKVTLELRPQCREGESLVTLDEMCPGAGKWQCQGPEACLAWSHKCKEAGAAEDGRRARRGGVVVGGTYHRGPCRPQRDLELYPG